MKMDSKAVIQLLVCLTLTFVVSFVGAQGSLIGLGEWYDGLVKPGFNPPNWVFAPVWTILYLMMGVAVFLIWRSDTPKRTLAITVYAIQLVLNGLWSWLFFAWGKLLESSIEITILIALVSATIFVFWPINRRAAQLLMPYLAWITFAAVLNWSIWSLNR